jgi:hypothetical protein
MDTFSWLLSAFVTVLLLVPSAVVAYACAVYAARAPSRWARLLAVGASGTFAVVVGSQVFDWFILPGLYGANDSTASGLLGGFLFVAGIGFGLLFAVALAVVLLAAREESA